MSRQFLIFAILTLPFTLVAQFNTDNSISVFKKSIKFPNVRIFSYEETPNAQQGYGYFGMYNYGGIQTAPKVTLKNRYLGRILFGGHNGERPINNGSISILTKDNFSNPDYPTRMDFRLGGTAGSLLRMSIDSKTGNVGIGTPFARNKLEVNGTIRSKEVKVEASPWPDFVFEKVYQLPTLEEVGTHIKEKGHLKDIPSALEVAKNGINLGEMDAKLLQKIEELTLYTIQQHKEITRLKQIVDTLVKNKNE